LIFLPVEDAPADADPLETEEPLLSQLYSASVQGRIAAGPRAGQGVVRLGDRIDAEEVEAITGPRCASVQGFSLHADVCVPARDRRRLERLVRCYPTDESSIAFGTAGATPADGVSTYLDDLNGDGLMDLVSHYWTPETGIALGDTEACLTGETLDGVPFEGCDSVRMVPLR